MGFRGVRGAGGVGGGGFHSTSQPRSSSSSSSSSSSDDLIRNAAVTANSPKSLWSAYSADDVKHCKMLVRFFEMCTRRHKEDGGKEHPFCQSDLQNLEKDCAKFKPSWSDWWTNELEKGYCFALKRTYDMCIRKHTEDKDRAFYCDGLMKEWKEFCA